MLALILVGIGGQAACSQETEPLVARLQMRLTLDSKVLDVIEKGDLLTVLGERNNSYIIQTFSGHKGAVSKVNAVKLEEAVPIYDELIEENPEEGRLYTLRASARWAAGAVEQALQDYDQAIELGYDAAHAYASRGLFHAAMNSHDAAIADYTAAIEKDPQDEIPLVNRAAVFMATGKFDKAIEDYSSAIAKRPDNPILYSQRAVALKMSGQIEAAIEDYDRTLELSAEDISAWMGRGFLHFQLQQHEAAIKDFSQATELAPQSAVAFNNRGYNYQLLGEHQKALHDFERAVELAPTYLLALQNKAWLLTICDDQKLRNPDSAIETAKQVCEITEFKDPSDLTLLAAAYAAAGEFATAIGWQEKVIELATEQQRLVSKKILNLYQHERSFDPRLLEERADQSTVPQAN